MNNNKKYLIRDKKIITREYLFRKKDEFHKNQAKLPFEEKIKILVELQKIATSIPHSHSKKSLVWNI
jgi:hypothetical protein